MMIDLRGIRTTNLGSELLLRAVVQELGEQYELAVGWEAVSMAERLELGLHVSIPGHPRIPDRPFIYGQRLLPQRLQSELRGRVGVVTENDCDVILDASGFRYTSQFGVGPIRWARKKYER